jgi:hypothetical protein
MDLDVVAGSVTTLKKNGFKILEDGAFTRAMRSLSNEERADARAVIDALEHDAYAGQVVEFLEDDARARYGTEEAWDALRLAVLELFDDA